jgi:hypothetical protein
MARFVVLVSLLVAACLFCSPFCPAQTDPISEQGLKPFGSYHGGDIDVVSLMNGKLDLHVPVVSYPQRGGKLHMGFTLRYNNPLISVTQLCTPLPCQYVTLFVPQGVQVLPDFKMALTGYVANNKDVTLLQLVDGSTHELGILSGTVSETLDGTGYRYDSGSDTTTDRQGVRYTGAGTTGLISQQDPNGNVITASNSGWTDSIGRVIPKPPSAGATNTSDYSNCTGSQPTTGGLQLDYSWT